MNENKDITFGDFKRILSEGCNLSLNSYGYGGILNFIAGMYFMSAEYKRIQSQTIDDPEIKQLKNDVARIHTDRACKIVEMLDKLGYYDITD